LPSPCTTIFVTRSSITLLIAAATVIWREVFGPTGVSVTGGNIRRS
jgi:hypothetical protein